MATSTILPLSDKDLARFSAYVQKTKECWLWTGKTNRPRTTSHPYGMFTVCREGVKTTVYAHRLAFMLAGGTIEDRQIVMHSCDNTLCVRPEHLRSGQPFENMHEKYAKGRSSMGGHLPIRVFLRLGQVAYAAGHTQESLAEASGIPLYTIAHLWQNKVVHVDLGVLTRLCEVLEVEPGDLLVKAA